ncbi:acyl-phosphate glycerol 3-phosphate acyltransferase [Lysinibacillus endophyticus]|uniref:Acyl-phosphate glycerol 3-phosphate acyltransferase n=1 Tax=Ureibacillus endophyticus TaxID=1978490 RepID=A0A494Z7E1_9BACL|nr:acyl-phosphate glycerol 3-phosphate acyltransferase [Lysinibacillus endophyticus]MCP1145103.1 acyl-phosphate glycerol 3-phosphate acyltransferase [Lysinibacillus endophyticus]RKQ18521.1 acyl-phosphate glycerol 3-phosphate acyltransferase [Lysinibacillus endophyticus]
MNQPKMNPAVLRLLVIFPNVLSYILLFGVIIYITTNYANLKAANALNLWLIIAVVLGPMAIYTTYSIIKRIKAGVL